MTAVYNNLVRPSTVFLDGQRTRNLQTPFGMKVAEKLRQIRESLPSALGPREAARRMGKPDTPNAYSYYESKQFTRETLPLDKAREIAAIFADFGGDPSEVLALAGLAGNDAEAEVKAIQDDRPQIVTITMPVVLPSAVDLTVMFGGLLEAAGRLDLADELAPQLAQRFPAALERSLAHRPSPALGARKSHGADVPQPAKDRPEHQ
jgi:hypothetical protein